MNRSLQLAWLSLVLSGALALVNAADLLDFNVAPVGGLVKDGRGVEFIVRLRNRGPERKATLIVKDPELRPREVLLREEVSLPTGSWREYRIAVVPPFGRARSLQVTLKMPGARPLDWSPGRTILPFMLGDRGVLIIGSQVPPEGALRNLTAELYWFDYRGQGSPGGPGMFPPPSMGPPGAGPPGPPGYYGWTAAKAGGGMMPGAYVQPALPNLRSSSTTRKARVMAGWCSEREAPSSWLGYDPVDVTLLYECTSSQMSNEQVKALTDWVACGGRLVVVLGKDDRLLRDERLAPLLPVRMEGVTRVPSRTKPARRSGLPGGRLHIAGLPLARCRPTGGTVAAREGSLPIMVIREHGLGQVVVLAVDPFAVASAMAQHGLEQDRFWSDVLGLSETRFPYHLLSQAYGMNEATAQMRELRAPPAAFAGWFLLAFVLLAVPGNFLMLRRLRKRQWGWLTGPLMAVLFSGVGYGFGLAWKGTDSILSQAAVVLARCSAPTGRALVGLGLFTGVTPTRSLHFDPRVVDVTKSLVYGFYGYREDEFGPTKAAEVLLGEDGIAFRNVSGPLWSLVSFNVETTTDLGDGLRCTLDAHGSRIVANVVNRTGWTLKNVRFVAGNQLVKVGTLTPGKAGQVVFDFGGRGLLRYGALRKLPMATQTDFTSMETRRKADLLNSVLLAIGRAGPQQGGAYWVPFGSRYAHLRAWVEDSVVPVSSSPPISAHRTLALLVMPLPSRLKDGRLFLQPEACVPNYLRPRSDLGGAGFHGFTLNWWPCEIVFRLPVEYRRVEWDALWLAAALRDEGRPSSFPPGAKTPRGYKPPKWQGNLSIFNFRTSTWTRLCGMKKLRDTFALNPGNDYADPKTGVVLLRGYSRPWNATLTGLSLFGWGKAEE